MRTIYQGIDDMAAVELADGNQIEGGDEETHPTGKGNGVQQHELVAGNVLYDTLNDKLMTNLLRWSKENLWPLPKDTPVNYHSFVETCRKFYQDKTEKRLLKFYEKTNVHDASIERINTERLIWLITFFINLKKFDFFIINLELT